MRRSPTLVVAILCPHFGTPVEATRNTANDLLVDCRAKDTCATTSVDEHGVTIVVRPSGCPVFRRDGRS
jgi:hypothetical protein